MERQPLDSVEYESTYLELRPTWERVATTEAPNLTPRPQADVGAVASSPYPAADISLETADVPTSSTSPRNLAGQAMGRGHPRAVHPPGAPGDTPQRVTAGCCPCVASGHRASRHRARSWSLLGSGFAVAVSACLGFVADVDQHAARGLFIGVAGVLILGWARRAWRRTPRAAPFGADITQGVDRLVTALGTFFAVALWARYAPHTSAAFSRTIVMLLCGICLIRGLLAAARALHS